MPYIKIVLLIIILCACALSAPGSGNVPVSEVIATDDATPTLSLESLCQQKGYNWNPVDASCTYTQEGNPIIEIHYPIELVYYPLIDATMESYINDYRAAFEADFAEYGINDIGPWQLGLGYKIYQSDTHIISVEWGESFYTGGAHPGFGYTSFTFDTSTGQIVAFPDLFVEGVDPLSSVMQPVRDRLTAQLDASLSSFIDDGTDEIGDYSNFVLTDSALILLFEPYAVAPYVAGPQQVELPFSEFGHLIKEQFR